MLQKNSYKNVSQFPQMLSSTTVFNISYVSIQSYELNLCSKLEYCIKHLRIKYHFQNCRFLIIFHKISWKKIKFAAVGEGTFYKNLYTIKNELQSVQMKCGHVILFLEPAVCEHISGS